MRIKLKKISAKKGSDVLGFAMILPALCIIIYSVIVIAQLCQCRQSLEYALYEGSRAAVICEDYDTAYNSMCNIVKSTLQNSTFGVDDDDIDVQLNLVAGTSSTPGSPGVGGIAWEKGALAECTVVIKIDKLLNIGGDTMTARIYVMVERPVRVY